MNKYFNKRGFELFSKRNYAEYVRHALTMVTPSEIVAMRYNEACHQEGDMKDFLPWMAANAKGTVLEIGVRAGHSTAALLSGVEKNGGVVLSVDITDCSRFYKGHPQWSFIQTSSQNPKLHLPPLDFVLIDGDHTRDGYKADLERVWPLVKPGGMILSHDIAPEPGKSLEDCPDEVTSWVVFADGSKMEFKDNYPSKGIGEEFDNFCQEHQNEIEHQKLPGKYGMGVIKKLVYDRELVQAL